MGDLIAAIEGNAPPPRRRPCRIADILSKLTEPEREALEAILADTENWSYDRVARTLRAAGWPNSTSCVAEHRSGTCGCAD